MGYTPYAVAAAAGVPAWNITHPNYTPTGATLGIGSTQPLSNFFATLAAAQAKYPNAGVTSLSQETDGAALAQLFHDWAFPELRPAGSYMSSLGLTFAQVGGRVEGKGSVIKANAAGITYMMTMAAFNAGARDLTVDGGVFADNSLLANGTLGLNGATYGWRLQDCADAHFDNIGANNCKSYGFLADANGTPGNIADFCQFDNIHANNNGVLDIWKLTLSASVSGTFTLTLNDRFGTAHTTGNITIGTTTIGGALAYNVAGLPNPGGAGTGGTMESIIGLALHHPTVPQGLKTYGFGSKQAQSVVVDSTSTGLNATGGGTVIVAGGAYFLICQGDLLGPQTITVNSGGLSGGTVTATHVQAGVKGGGFGFNTGQDSNFYKFNSPALRSNFGDGLLLAGSTTWQIENMDGEFNYGSSLRIEGGGNSTTLNAMIFGGDYEGCWAPVILETASLGGGVNGGGVSKMTYYGDPTRDLHNVVIGQGGVTLAWFQDGNQITLAAG